jgi:hypothetical protein
MTCRPATRSEWCALAVTLPISASGEATASIPVHAKYAAPTKSAQGSSSLFPQSLWHGGVKTPKDSRYHISDSEYKPCEGRENVDLFFDVLNLSLMSV